MLRHTFFWLHLVAGVVAGLVIAIMAFTGTAIAFEKELVAWAESDVRFVTPPEETTKRESVNELLRRVHEVQSNARPTSITISANLASATAIALGRDAVYYVNPYTGEIRKPSSTRVRDFMHLMESWHRSLGFSGEQSRGVGKIITGACNAAFLFLAVSGLYLWWPHHWSGRGIKALAVFNLRLAGKARDFNWHNSIGLWTAPILIVLTLTALPISYHWANNLVYRLTGTEPPAQGTRSRPGSGASAIVVPSLEPSAKPLAYDALLTTVQHEFPQWSEITFRLVPDRGDRPRLPPAVNVTVRAADQWPLFATTTLTLDPFTGIVLRKEIFADQNAGRRMRMWTRFLHTGEALGWPGKLLAALASSGALVLVWTGFALSWRRFFPRQKPTGGPIVTLPSCGPHAAETGRRSRDLRMHLTVQ
jgi:uncharacterized iron-regulated membrane protein